MHANYTTRPDFYHQLLECGKIGVWEIHYPSYRFQLHGQAYLEAITGFPGSSVPENWMAYLNDNCHPDDRSRVLLSVQESFLVTGQLELSHRLWNDYHGEWRWVYVFGWVSHTDVATHEICMMGGTQSIHNHRAFQDALQHLRETDERAQIMLDSSPMCCNLWNENIENIDCNQAAPRLFGCSSKKEYLECFDRLSPEYQPDGSHSYETIRKRISQSFGAGIQTFSWLHQTLNGEPIPTLITLVPVRQPSGGQIVLAYVQDQRQQQQMLAEIETTQQELRQAKEIAERSARSKSDFLANMSHEIRTPMNAILGMLHLMENDELSVKQRHYLSNVKQASNALLDIINQILDFSKIEAGKLSMEQVDFQLETVLTDLANLLVQDALDKDLQLYLDLEPEVPHYLMGDSFRLRQVLINLVGNAIKFTSKGSVGLEIELDQTVGQEEADNHVALHIVVRDTGIGISKEQVESLFAPFSQADSSTTRKFGGTGLGLAICQSVVQMLDGRIWCESELGKGSAFHFTCRFRRSIQDVPTGPPAPRVLLLGKAGPSLTVLCLRLQLLRCRVDRRFCGLAVKDLTLSQADLQGIQMIVADLDDAPSQIPSLVSSIRAVADKSLPVVLVCDKEQAAQLPIPDGHSSLMARDLTTTEFYQHIATVWGDHLGVRYPSMPSSRRSKEDFTARLQGRRILLAEDNEINQILAVELLESKGMQVDVAQNGREALALLEQKGPYDLILMDIQMPEMDGTTASRMIRKDSRFSAIPIIAMTAHATTEAYDYSLENGMNDHLTKPIDPDTLYRTLDHWILPTVEM